MLPTAILDSHWYAALSAFVSINTAIYATLALTKTLPKIYFGDYFRRNYTRSETRSIYPDAEEKGREKRKR